MIDNETGEEQPSDELLQEAKLELSRAVAAFTELLAPGSYVDGWVLATRRIAPDGPHAGKSIVNVSSGPDQDWVVTRGLAEVMIETVREGGA